MNVGRALEFARQLVELDSQHAVASRLGNISNRIQDIVNSPQEVQHQAAALSAVKELKDALSGLGGALNDSLRDFLRETGGDVFFLMSMADEIEVQIRSSGITAAVAKGSVDQLSAKRSKYIESLKQMQNSLKQLRFSEEPLQPGEAEVGFKIPRDLIENKIIYLADELEFINFTMGTFSEAVTGRRDEAEVGSLATSDPLVVVKTFVEIALEISIATKLLIDAYGKYVDILKFKPEMKKIDMPAETLQHLDIRAEKELDKGIEGIVDKIIRAKDGRVNEVRTALRKVLKGMAAKFELGFKVEVRFIASNKEGLSPEHAEEAAKKEERLRELQRETVYPELPKEPLLQLPKRKRRSNKLPDDPKKKGAAASKGRRGKGGAHVADQPDNDDDDSVEAAE